MAEVIVLEEALEELHEALFYYGRVSRDLGLRLHAEYETKLALIAGNPELYRPGRDRTRRANLAPFPYYLAYLHRESDASIWILALGHTARRPFYWKHRIPDER